MRTHPDADGFIRAILANPADPTPRLVFADWLDDTGEPGNAAWAEYIRARAGMQQFNGGPYWQFTRLRHQAKNVSQLLKARLTLPVGTLTHRLPDLFDLLPPHRFTARLAEAPIPHSLLELCPESVVREYLSIPVWFQAPDVRGESVLVFAAARPTDADSLLRLSAILGRTVYLVASGPDDIQDAIFRHYGPEEYVNIRDLDADEIARLQIPGPTMVESAEYRPD